MTNTALIRVVIADLVEFQILDRRTTVRKHPNDGGPDRWVLGLIGWDTSDFHINPPKISITLVQHPTSAAMFIAGRNNNFETFLGHSRLDWMRELSTEIKAHIGYRPPLDTL